MNLPYLSGIASLGILGILWYVCIIVQVFMSYGTAYRLTKKGGDNGISLWGWMIVLNLASAVPGLGIFLWVKNRKTPQNNQYDYDQQYQHPQQYQQHQQPQQYPPAQYPLRTVCQNCGGQYNPEQSSCPHCGYQPPVN
jgi:hypothetical protein